MAIIVVQAPGLLTTVQDLGRPGYGLLGVSASGAADPISLRIGNRLLGNEENAPALEMTLKGGTFAFPEGCTIALTGAAFDGPAPMWSTMNLAAGTVLQIGKAVSGARCYLCVRGGIEAAHVLGSASTHLRSGLGPKRPVAGDVLLTGSAVTGPPFRKVRRNALEHLAPRKTLRATGGDLSGSYEVSERSDRMGIRLRGDALPDLGGEMTTEGVPLGAIQVPPDGQPIIVFVDAQTTGGYPVIANVISADLPSLGQLRPRDHVSFETVTMDHARELLFKQEQLLRGDGLLW